MSISGLTSDWKMLMIPGGPEESKVKLWHRVSLLSALKKRGASRVAHFLHSISKEQAPPQSGEGSLLRWFWSFTGASIGPWQPEPAPPSLLCLSQLSLLHLLHERQIESSRRATNLPSPQLQLAAVEFPHNLLDRPACRQAPLNRLLQALLV